MPVQNIGQNDMTFSVGEPQSLEVCNEEMSEAEAEPKYWARNRVATKRVKDGRAKPSPTLGCITCKFCGREFSKKTSLGGHMSKMHPDSSDKYRKKMETRNANAPDRERLKRAKAYFANVPKHINFRAEATLVKKLL